MKWIAYGAATALTLLLVVLFAIALPDATARAREGHRRTAESSCDALQPAPQNPMLGLLPASAPDFTLKDFSGRDISLSAFRGNVVLVNFWATWCNTCEVEMPSMEKLAREMKKKGKPFRMLAVSVDDNWDAIRQWQQHKLDGLFSHGTSFDVLLDTSREVPKRWGTEKFPESFLIDADGKIRYYIISDRDWSQPIVSQCIDALLDS